MKRQDLFNAMLSRAKVFLFGQVVTIQSIEMEDGSGFCFNVGLYNPYSHEHFTRFIRCVG